MEKGKHLHETRIGDAALLVVFLSIFAFAISGASAEPSRQLLLVKERVAACVIIHASDAVPCVRVACSELQQHLQAISGVVIPVIQDPGPKVMLREICSEQSVVFVGASRFTREMGVDEKDIPSEGFVIECGPNTLAIVGNDGPTYGDNFPIQL